MTGVRQLLAPLAGVPALKGAGRAVVRQGAVATSRWRPDPDFLIIGAKRGGTTSMYRYLLEHPQVLPLFPSARRLPLASEMKGVHFFDSHWDEGPAWYRSHFASERARARRSDALGLPVVTGESSPYYLFQPRAAQRAAATVPGARIVVMLRDPVDRTFSHWKEQTRRGREALGFAEAVAAEPLRLAGEHERLLRDDRATSEAHEHQGYVHQSCYDEGLREWLAHFDREQVLVVWSDEFYRDPAPVFEQVCRHVGIASRPIADAKVWNAAAARSPMPDEVRADLRARFAPHDAHLQELLGTPLGWTPASAP